eukprot:g18578.t1
MLRHGPVRSARHAVLALTSCQHLARTRAASGVSDAELVFGKLSKTIHRGFKFDRMFPSDDLDPEALLELDQLALTSMKTQDAPRPVMEKIVRLLRDFGQKKDLERYGRYLLKRQRSRTFLEEEKFSFLCIRRAPGPRSMYACEEHAPTAHEKSYFWPRILFPVIKAGGHCLVDVCAAPQNFERLSVSKSKPHTFGDLGGRNVRWTPTT